jgi:hypothetical protein
MSLTTALRTRIFVRRAAILDLLPIGLNNNWPYSGRVMDHGTIGPQDEDYRPIIRSGERKVWIVPQEGAKEFSE